MVFGDHGSERFLPEFAWTEIVRNQLVKLGASPDDLALTEYWARRRRKEVIPLIDKTDWHLLNRQNGRCPLCGTLLLHAAPADDGSSPPPARGRTSACQRATGPA